MTKLKIKLKSYDVPLLESTAVKIIDVAKENKAKVSGPVPMPTRTEKFTILRSTHVNKKSREQFEMRTHKRLIVLNNVDKKLLDKLNRLHLASGIHYEIIVDSK